MSVFISWAEKESFSHEGALLLQKWLPEVLPNLECFVSSEDIGSGSLWLQKLFEQLDGAESGILCLTKESLERNWILFEAGALAKWAGSKTGRVCPLLFETKSLNFPLAAFQARFLDKTDETRSKKEMFLLIKTLNQNRHEALCLAEDQLERQFNRCWSEYWNPYEKLCEKHAFAKKPATATKITNEEILTEMRGAFRQFADALTEIRRNSSAVTSAEQSAELQQFAVQCPFCNGSSEVLMPDHGGATKPTICSSCGKRFNVHMTAEHSAFVRPIAPISTIRAQLPMITEAVQCPNCQEALTIELPERPGETRSRFCPKCGNAVNAHRTTTGGVRIGGKFNGPNNDWALFLNSTDAWVEPSAVIPFISMAAEASAKSSEGVEVTPDGLSKMIIHRIGADHLGLAKSMVRPFVKLLFLGGAFQFPPEVEKGWKTPLANVLNQPLLIQAYARGVVHRLKAKFILTPAELPQLCQLLFPNDTVGADEALRQALAEIAKNQNQGLTEEGINR